MLFLGCVGVCWLIHVLSYKECVCFILCRMYSGSSLHVECVLPFGMLCLSVWRMILVKMVFALCMSGGS